MKETVTPLMQQYLDIKEKYLEEIVFFQVGDFYEIFFQDAKIAASILGITLTKRGVYKDEHIPLCGVPVHMIESYYPKLLKQGYTIVICNQNEIAQPGKLVSRVVSEIITPSSVLNSDADEHIYSLFVTIVDNALYSFWFEFGKQHIMYKIFSYDHSGKFSFVSVFQAHTPSEIITDKNSVDMLSVLLSGGKRIKIIDHEQPVTGVDAFLLRYNLSTQWSSLTHIFLLYMQKYFENLMQKNYFFFQEISYTETVFIDKATIKYLECTQSINHHSKQGSLYDILDQTSTKMGSRLLKEWILYPLKNQCLIEQRHSFIQYFLHLDERQRLEWKNILRAFGDIERFLHRLRLKKNRPSHLPQLVSFMFAWHGFKKIYSTQEIFFGNYIDTNVIPQLFEERILHTLIHSDSEPLQIDNNFHYINYRSSAKLQDLYNVLFNQDASLQDILNEERNKTSITDLVIKKTPLYGYTFELSKHKDQKYILPNYFKRVQTLSQKERYTTPLLEDFSRNAENAYEMYCQEEAQVIDLLSEYVIDHLGILFSLIEKIKYLDVCLSLSLVAYEYKWVKPEMVPAGDPLSICDGKHPVIAATMGRYVANSLSLDQQTKMYMITGPNMGGKSTYMRQNALIILLAHIGSYVPAQSARIPLMEKILTRVGASDNMLEGKSTFYVELEELMTIITLANQYSFVIIDEIGRGTSTYDGMSLAASFIDYITVVNKPYILCATHYHELADIIINDTIAWCFMDAITDSSGIIFLYQIKKGVAADSMGILLAKQVGFPEVLVDQANHYFRELKTKNISPVIQSSSHTNVQPASVGNYSDVISTLVDLDLNHVSPIQAHLLLSDIQKQIAKK
jgi:DNA mismatch repair protein MutS